MVNDQRYQSILDSYFAQVAAATREFESILEENTELLKKIAEASRSGVEKNEEESAEPPQPYAHGVSGATGAGGAARAREPQIFDEPARP